MPNGNEDNTLAAVPVGGKTIADCCEVGVKVGNAMHIPSDHSK